MCQFSVTAGNRRDAVQNEDLVVSRAPHGGSNWLTQAGAPDVAVCIPHSATLSIQSIETKKFRGANFEQLGDHDFLKFIDGERERVSLNVLQLGTQIRVLSLSMIPPARAQSTINQMAEEHRRHKVPISSFVAS